jgi:hypothetical protein
VRADIEPSIPASKVWNDRIEHAKEMFQLVAGVGLRHFAAFEASLEQEKDSADFLLVKRLDTWLFSEDFERQAEPYFLDRFKEWWSSRGSPGVLPAQVDLAFAKASLTEHLHEVIATIKAKAELIAKAESFVAQGDVPASINDIRSRMNQAEMDASAAKRKEDRSNRHREPIDTLDHFGRRRRARLAHQSCACQDADLRRGIGGRGIVQLAFRRWMLDSIGRCAVVYFWHQKPDGAAYSRPDNG